MNAQLKRLIAGVIDIMVLSVTTASFFTFIFALSTFLSYFTGNRLQSLNVMNTFTLIAVITMYETICLYFLKGKTLGKMIFGLQVKRMNPVKEQEDKTQRQMNKNEKADIFEEKDLDVALANELDIYTCLLRGLIKGIVLASFSGIILILNIVLIALGETSTMIYDGVAKTKVEIEGGL